MIREVINWHDVPDELPDADVTVLLYTDDESEPVWFGWLDEEGWVYIDGAPVGGVVKRWAHVPKGEANA